MLKRPDLGARVCGLVLDVEEPKRYEGKNQDGSAYVSISRRLHIWTGSGSAAVVCGERVKHEAEFRPVEVGSFVTLPILGAKTDGKQMVFRVTVP